MIQKRLQTMVLDLYRMEDYIKLQNLSYFNPQIKPISNKSSSGPTIRYALINISEHIIAILSNYLFK